MSKRTFVQSPAERLHAIVIDEYGGRVSIDKILINRSFREGYEASDIYRFVAQLRKRYKGQICKKGVEAWEIISKEIIALEHLLTKENRRDIQFRRRALERGFAAASILDNRIFQSKIARDGITHKKEIKSVVDASTDSLEVVSETAHLTTRVLTDYSKEFEKPESSEKRQTK